jgi:hypothetical protein
MEDTQICKFKPQRKNQQPCTAEATTPYGFCSRHAGSVQALEAKRKYEERETNSESEDDSSEREEQVKKSTPSTAPAEKKVKTLTIGPNKYGHFVHEETGIMFNPETKEAFAVEVAGGKVNPLDDKHIALCEKYGFKYKKQPIRNDYTESEDEEDSEFADEGEDSSETASETASEEEDVYTDESSSYSSGDSEEEESSGSEDGSYESSGDEDGSYESASEEEAYDEDDE